MDEPAPPSTAHAARRSDLVPVAFLGVLFVVSIGLAMAVAGTFADAGVQAFEDPESLVNPLYYLVIVVVFTVVILVLARRGWKRVIQYVILGAVFATIDYVLWPLLHGPLGATWGLAVSLGGAAGLTALLYFWPEWWVIDAVGVLVSAGAAAVFGISFGLAPALLLLAAFAVYDAIAVYRTKHMIDLADSVLELRLPIMFVVPKRRGYSFLAETTRIKEKMQSGEERDAMFMGLGDVVFPAVLVVSALHFLHPARSGVNAEAWGIAGHFLVSLATLAGALAGYVLLMWFVLRGRPHAGLPSLNGGAIVGFLAALLPIYGVGPILP